MIKYNWHDNVFGRRITMASQVTNYQCPACGGAMHFDATSGKLKCDFCESYYSVEEVEEFMREKNEKAVEAMNQVAKDDWKTSEFASDWGEGSENMKSYDCPACGAELVCDESTAATCCPYCGNKTIIPGQFSGSLKPEYVIPFKTTKEQAKEALKDHYKGKRLLPDSFASGNRIEDIQGVYVPFWMYDCEATGQINYTAEKSTKQETNDEEITITEHFEVTRAGSLKFEKIPVDASTRMPDGHMDSIEPYNYTEMKDFSMAYMPGFLADKYDEDAEKCGSRMEERVEKSFVDEVDNTVTGYDSFDMEDKSVKISKGEAHYAMLPVWMLATKWNDQNFIFAMNGQTGKLVGDLPVDQGKKWSYLAGIGAALMALMLILNFFVFSKQLTGLMFVLTCFVLPIVIAFISVGVMESSMKSVRKQKAEHYITGDGIKLTVKRDQYINTTTERRKKDK